MSVYKVLTRKKNCCLLLVGFERKSSVHAIAFSCHLSRTKLSPVVENQKTNGEEDIQGQYRLLPRH